MSVPFFGALLGCIAAPVILSRVLRIGSIFPLVFVQLLFGLALQVSGASAWLQQRGMDLQHGPLADSLFGLGMLGISLLIALTGAEAAPGDGGRQAWRFIPISIAGFGATCLVGSVAGYLLSQARPELMGVQADPLVFAGAIGLALSVTALPVLAAILRETGLAGTPLGKLATNCAMLDDLWMWLGLAVVLSLTAAGTRAPATLLLAVLAYLAAMLWLVRPLLTRVLAALPEQGSDRLVLAVSVVFLSALATDAIGLHAMLGTFVAGAILPRAALQGWREPLVHVSHVMLLPFFFILTGMRLRIDINDPGFLQLTGALTATAVLCKLFSVAAAARCCGMRWRQAFALGSLMQCKGLMELVAINILLDAGVISVQVFSALAMMALLSTFFTAPALRLVWRNGAPPSPSSAELPGLNLAERA